MGLCLTGRFCFVSHDLGVKEVIYDNGRSVKRSLHAVIIPNVRKIIPQAVITHNIIKFVPVR